ncbi:tRNA epoxyqueuosine(34) reductase QueG, partial [Candidatus Peregrinibacteria bacterium]|nr:tRNA epoxyqueuosine(34) reductase QueG [Candidatus Peregrinibacteria bacterium]
ARLAQHRPVFDAWVAQGLHAGMDYLPRMAEDRYHPDRKLPEVKSAIVLAAWYGYEQKNCSTGHGKVSRYAGGRDYHKVLKKKLIALSDWLKAQEPGCETFVSVDSGPTVDRVLAECAGLGFFGKNSLLINPSRGSYFLIGSVLTTLALTPTAKPPMPNCGNCTRCAVACPTGAIGKNGVIDANRCISYLTIENKGSIPVELRPKIGNRVFGCDICQEVCPFTLGRATQQTVLIAELKPDAGVGESLDLAELLSIRTDEAFLKRFAGTPLMRAKRRGLLRNACVVAGNSGEPMLIPHLERILDEESDEMLKEHATWAIARLKKID